MELAAGGRSRADPTFMATLLSPLALSPDPLDHLFPWMLLQSLQAIDAIPNTASPDEVCPDVGSCPHKDQAQMSMQQQYRAQSLAVLHIAQMPATYSAQCSHVAAHFPVRVCHLCLRPPSSCMCMAQVCAVHMSLISQLERLSGLEEWALYVALHLPDGSPGDRGLVRDDLVLQLLHRHAPLWAASEQKQDFLTSTLGLPPAWLASALATFAAYRKSRVRRASSDYLRIAEGEIKIKPRQVATLYA